MIAYAERGDLFGWDSGDCINVNIEVGHRSICEISTLMVNGNVWAKLSGRARHLQQAWRQADRSPYRSQTECYAQIGGWIAASLFSPSIHMITLDHGTPFEPQAPELRVLNVVGLGPEERQHAVWITEQPGAGNLHFFLLSRSQVGEESCYAGLLLLERTTANITKWHRVAISMWLTSHLSDPDGGTIAFHRFPKTTQPKDTLLSNAILFNPKVPYVQVPCETRYQEH